MPTLQLKISPPQNPDLYPLLAEELTAVTVEQLGKRGDVTAVMIEELPAVRWYVGAAAAQQATAWLEIDITAGTNTLAQKAAFIEAVFAVLQRRLGGGRPLEPASYIIVCELPATDWGYGGRTQQARKRARAVASGEVVE